MRPQIEFGIAELLAVRGCFKIEIDRLPSPHCLLCNMFGQCRLAGLSRAQQDNGWKLFQPVENSL